ncbi:transcription termination/antitermination protein NusG [Aureispira anguillae]|uniref:Transcription termination/antitermination protein NusG n=1 Tax=Aureispira anguillae TaxID=2864201 RepID=A0A916DWJ9_9BACT|nr:transcription termination/antitermination protein NusG [Aureispira anguillae]BDS14111.1 transcription termination/antitermination protein NusG [Aureispira anguillae]
MGAVETKWYCLRVVSNKERKIKERLDLEIDRNGWRDLVPNIIVPTEKVYKIRNGKKVIQERTLTPGYILVEAVVRNTPTGMKSSLNGNVIQAMTSIKDVIHFLGKKNPIPMRDHEITRILSKVDQSSETGESLADPFLVGEDVKVTDGPFKDFPGVVKAVNEEKKKLTIITKVFGRETEVELNFMQVEKNS